MKCRWDREAKAHLLREHRSDCNIVECRGCLPCMHDDAGNPVRHCRTRTRCTSHLGWDDHTCPECLGKIRGNMTAILDAMALMPEEALERGINSEPANLAGPHADYVTSQWRLVNADRAGQTVEELDMRDPYTCLTMYERTIREDLNHDDVTLVSATIGGAASYLAWVLTDLARDDEQTETLTALLGATTVLRAHVEAALRDSRAPERGIPCPECSATLEQARAAAGEDADLSARGKAAPRLVRHYSHWCDSERCERIHHRDQIGDEWRCPQDPAHVWSHTDYEARLVKRKRSA